MIDLLADFVLSVANKIAARSIEYIALKVERRRTALSHLLNLYSSLVELENISLEVLSKFEGYAGGTETITNIIPAEKLKKLDDYFKNYTEKLDTVMRILEIYDLSTAFSLVRVEWDKGRAWKTLDCTQYILPHMRSERDERTKMLIPKKLPDNIPDESLDPDEVFGLFDSSEVDLRESPSLSDALKNGREAICTIEKSKMLLGKLIKDNFPLKDILI